MDAGETTCAAEFKTHCLEILDRLSAVAVLVAGRFTVSCVAPWSLRPEPT
jgi:hypothetical protein